MISHQGMLIRKVWLQHFFLQHEFLMLSQMTNGLYLLNINKKEIKFFWTQCTGIFDHRPDFATSAILSQSNDKYKWVFLPPLSHHARSYTNIQKNIRE